MAGFDDLVTQASLSGGALCAFSPAATEGKSWEWNIEPLVDDDGAEVSMSGVTAVCKALTKVDGTTVVTGSVTAVGNGWRVTFAPSDTAGTASTGNLTRKCPWHFTLTNGAGRKVDVWGVQHSALVIGQGD